MVAYKANHLYKLSLILSSQSKFKAHDKSIELTQDLLYVLRGRLITIPEWCMLDVFDYNHVDHV